MSIEQNRLKITLSQQVVDHDPFENLALVEERVLSAEPGEWIVFPEAVLSGYAPEDQDYISRLDPIALRDGVRRIAELTSARACICLFGSAMPYDAGWQNAAFVAAEGEIVGRRGKRELSQLDQKHFVPAAEPAVHNIADIPFAIQLCRELLFPATWSTLRQQGAKIVFHLNNAIKPKDAIWRHLLISRAVENGCFVCSVNNAAEPQELGSFLIGPDGEVIVEIEPRRSEAVSAEIDLGRVSFDMARRFDF